MIVGFHAMIVYYAKYCILDLLTVYLCCCLFTSLLVFDLVQCNELCK